MVLQNNSKTTEVSTEKFLARLNRYNVVEVLWRDNISEVNAKDLLLLREALFKIGGGSKLLVYNAANTFLPLTPEARAYFSRAEASEYTLANAALIDSLPKRILFNAYLRMSKPIVPTRGFGSFEDAMKWLSTFNDSL